VPARVTTILLFHLAVLSVLAARVAELFRLHTVGVLLLVFGGRVVPMLAVIALQSDNFAHFPAFP
jgi:hypothetical protein